MACSFGIQRVRPCPGIVMKVDISSGSEEQALFRKVMPEHLGQAVSARLI